MALPSTAAQSLSLDVQPQMPECLTQQDLWQRNTSSLIKELLDKSQASRQYQIHIESRLREENARLQQERQHSSQLEQKVADLQWARNQAESVLRQTASDANWIRHELEVQTKKSQELDSQVVALASLNESLLKMLFDSASAESRAQAKPTDIFQMYSDMQNHAESIKALHASNRCHEESIQALNAAFHAALYAGSFSGSLCGSDSTTIIDQESGVEGEFPSELPTKNPMELLHNAQEGTTKEGSWYEE
ncbi:hypothetical protein BJX76DRAFT_362725 [Aspergillus varians]